MSTTYASTSGERIGKDERERIVCQANVRLFEPSRPYFWQFSKGLFAALPSMIWNSSFVHIHGLHMFASVYTYLICRVFRKPYGIQTHGVLEPYDRAHSAGRKRVFMLLIGNAMFGHAQYVAFGSESEAKNAADIVPLRRQLVAPLGVSLSAHERPNNETLASAIERVGREKSFLYLGRYTAKKQPRLVIEAWAKGHPDGSFLFLVGPDGSVTADQLRSDAARLGVSNSVLVAGLMSAAKCAWLYARCGFFVLPSRNENFGLTAVEAMASGCYVITTSDVAASAHVVRSGGGEVLDSPSAAELSEAYLRAPSRLGLASANAPYAGSEVTWARTASIIHERIERALSSLDTDGRRRH